MTEGHVEAWQQWSQWRLRWEPGNDELGRKVAEEPGDRGHEGGMTTVAMDG